MARKFHYAKYMACSSFTLLGFDLCVTYHHPIRVILMLLPSTCWKDMDQFVGECY